MNNPEFQHFSDPKHVHSILNRKGYERRTITYITPIKCLSISISYKDAKKVADLALNGDVELTVTTDLETHINIFIERGRVSL